MGLSMCQICRTRFADGQGMVIQGMYLSVCSVCYEIKIFIDGLNFDLNVDSMEELILKEPDNVVFSRGLKDEN